MFKAQKGLTQEDIVILDPQWNEETIGGLRQQGRDDELICPVCRQPVIVRAGEKKRWHFAHKDLTNCPLKHESPNVLQARGLLYSWLKSKLGERVTEVTVEKHFPGADLPRPVDCYVKLSDDQKIGYWILERGIRDRWKLQHTLSDLGVEIIWVPLTDMLLEDEEDQDTVHLTPTERDITFPSDYNQIYSYSNSSLSYLDVENMTVLTLRGLRCVHSPQKYQFDCKLVSGIDQMLYRSKTGEFVHPGEYEQLKEREKEIEEQERLEAIEEEKRLERERKRQKELEEQRKKRISQTNQREHQQYALRTSSPLFSRQKKQKKESEEFDFLFKPYPCRICGTMTTEEGWTSLDLREKTCLCNECSAKSRERLE